MLRCSGVYGASRAQGDSEDKGQRSKDVNVFLYKNLDVLDIDK